MDPKTKIGRKRKIKPCMDADKEAMKLKSKAENTQKAAQLWTNCFKEYLSRNELPDIDAISNEQLPNILENFFMEIRKVKKSADDSDNKESKDQFDSDSEDDLQFKYKNSTFKAMCPAL